LQQGRHAEAGKLMRAARARLEDNPKSRERAYYGTMFARYVLDTENWAAAGAFAAPEDLTIATPNYHFALAVAAIKNGELDTAREHMRYVRPAKGASPEAIGDEEVVEVLRTELEALFALADGDNDKAITLAREALALELSMAYKFGPPYVVKPAAELLGDLLLEAGKPEEAIGAYQDQLTRMPRRSRSLLGLARAAKEIGDEATATDAYRQLDAIWVNADTGIQTHAETRSAAGSS